MKNLTAKDKNLTDNDLYKSRKKRSIVILFSMLIFLMLFMMACLCIGKYSVSPSECLKVIFSFDKSSIKPMDMNVILGVRLPRILAAVFAGACLSLSGATYQSVFQNPLVSPEFLGVSSGACIGAATAILFAFNAAGIQAMAFAGGIIAVLLTLSIPKLIRSTSNIMLVLSGIIVSGAMTSILGFIKYIADPETELASITYWQMGSFAYVDMGSVISVLPISLITAAILICLSWRIDILSLGDKEARALGINVSRMQAVSVICATVLTAGAICIAGTIGWVGLVIPHFARMIVGAGNRILFPAACLIGGIFLLVVDTATRIIGPSEMPVSILTGIIGAPFYAWLLYHQRNSLR